jgi:hypothetical protein
LGNNEQLDSLSINDRVVGTPPMPGETHNNRQMGGCHAYAIDPMIAKRLVLQVMERGIDEPVDLMMRNEQFCIIQLGLFAYQIQGETTLSRSKHIF